MLATTVGLFLLLKNILLFVGLTISLRFVLRVAIQFVKRKFVSDATTDIEAKPISDSNMITPS